MDPIKNEEKVEADSIGESRVENINNDGRSIAPWTEEAERKLIRKVDFLVLPILWLCYVMLQLDRGNIGNALTDNLMVDVGIDQATLSTGQTLLQLGVVLFEIPSNVVLYRIGPRVWITFQIFAWGMVATFQSFINGRSQFLATRFLLGMFESGFVPAAFYMITVWYKPSEVSKRLNIFYSAVMFALAIGGVLAYAILQMRGVAGLAGWQWLFILEGIVTITMGIVFAVLFPGSPVAPKSLCGISFFNEEEKAILRSRMELSQGVMDANNKKKVTFKDIWFTISDLTMWPHLFISIMINNASGVYVLFAPSIVRSFGFEALRSNALASVGSWISLVFVIASGYFADWWGRRGLLVMCQTFITWVFVLTFKLLPLDAAANTKYALLMMGIATAVWYHPINVAWLALNARNSQDRALRMALITMAANLGGVTAPQILRAEDAPLYIVGWRNLAIIISCGFLCAIILVVTYATINARRSRRDPEKMGETSFTITRTRSSDGEGYATDGVKLYSVEIRDAEFEAISLAVAAGFTVIEPAANGGVDLDEPIQRDGDTVARSLLNRNSPDFRDPGALMVTMGSSTALHTRMPETNYGSRIDAYAWGQNITNTSVTSVYPYEDLYTALFSGSSGAAPIVAGVAPSIQGMVFANTGKKLSPTKMRSLITVGGTPSANGASDGMSLMPNLKALIDGGYLN